MSSFFYTWSGQMKTGTCLLVQHQDSFIRLDRSIAHNSICCCLMSLLEVHSKGSQVSCSWDVFSDGYQPTLMILTALIPTSREFWCIWLAYLGRNFLFVLSTWVRIQFTWIRRRIWIRRRSQQWHFMLRKVRELISICWCMSDALRIDNVLMPLILAV